MDTLLTSTQMRGAVLPAQLRNSPLARTPSQVRPSSLSLRVRSSRSGSSSETQSTTEAAPKPASSTSPFAGKKISSLLAARRTQAQEPAAAAQETPSTPAIQTPVAQPAQATSLNATIASLLKESSSSPAASATPAPAAKPLSPFASLPTSPPASRPSSVNAVPAGTSRAKLSFGKRNVIDALKADGGSLKGGSAMKAGSADAPANIFVDEVRSKEQIEAEKFKFEINQGQILLVVSFFASSIIMMATVYVVWKLGAIHYNEY